MRAVSAAARTTFLLRLHHGYHTNFRDLHPQDKAAHPSDVFQITINRGHDLLMGKVGGLLQLSKAIQKILVR